MKYRFTASLLAASLFLSGCGQAGGQAVLEKPAEESVRPANEEFTSFLNDYVVQVCEEDYTTAHHYFEYPENFGIDVSKAKISLGDFVPTDEDIRKSQELEASLKSFDRNDLDPAQQVIYDELVWSFDNFDASLKEEDYLYLDCIWSEYTSPASDLVFFFSEYEVRTEEDIAPLLDLINDCPNYVQKALDYSEKQAELGTLMISYDVVKQKCEDVLASKDDSSVESNLFGQIEGLDLGDAKTEEYKEKVSEALDASYYPAYQTILDNLDSLKEQSRETTGLANLPSGKSYYELVARAATSSSDSVSDMEQNLTNAVDDVISQWDALLDKDYMAVWQGLYYETDFSSVDAIMAFLDKNYTKLFPAVGTMQYVLTPLTDAESNAGTVAYFMVPPVDNTAKYRIRYNQRDYGSDPSSLDLYTTLAHEGIPGHMYEEQYDHEHFDYTIQYLISESGFTEGYASYVQFQALKLLDMDDTSRDAYILNELISWFYIALMDIDINYNGLDLDSFQDKYSSLFGTDMADMYEVLAQNPGTFLSYYYGYLEILQLRNKAVSELGDAFDDVAFNNALIEAGSVNFDIVTANVEAYIEANK